MNKLISLTIVSILCILVSKFVLAQQTDQYYNDGACFTALNRQVDTPNEGADTKKLIIKYLPQYESFKKQMEPLMTKCGALQSQGAQAQNQCATEMAAKLPQWVRSYKKGYVDATYLINSGKMDAGYITVAYCKLIY